MKKLSFPFPKSHYGMIVKCKSPFLYYGRIENNSTITWFKTNCERFPVPSVSEYGEHNADLLACYEILE
jgi:hypothetical protein